MKYFPSVPSIVMLVTSNGQWGSSPSLIAPVTGADVVFVDWVVGGCVGPTVEGVCVVNGCPSCTQI